MSLRTLDDLVNSQGTRSSNRMGRRGTAQRTETPYSLRNADQIRPAGTTRGSGRKRATPAYEKQGEVVPLDLIFRFNLPDEQQVVNEGLFVNLERPSVRIIQGQVDERLPVRLDKLKRVPDGMDVESVGVFIEWIDGSRVALSEENSDAIGEGFAALHKAKGAVTAKVVVECEFGSSDASSE